MLEGLLSGRVAPKNAQVAFEGLRTQYQGLRLAFDMTLASKQARPA